MNISYAQLAATITSLKDAIREDKPLLGFDAKIQQLSASDLHFFDTKEKAFDFQEFNQSQQKSIVLLPVAATYEYVTEEAHDALQRGRQHPDVMLDAGLILEMHAHTDFNRTLGSLLVAMDSFDWTKVFYDPLEANTDAENFQDKIQFNRLEYLVEQLSAFAQTGADAKAAVTELVNRYWTGEAMEVQIDGVLNGSERTAHENKMILGENDHPVSNDVLDKARIALANGKQWMAYNNDLYLIEKDDVHFFERRELADQFAFDNHSDRDHFNVIQIRSPEDILRKIPYGNQQFITSLNDNSMNMENFQFLQKLIKDKGFGEALYPELEKNIQAKKPEFELHFTTQVNNRPYDATLFFRKSDTSDMCFFNGYKASVERSNGEKIEQNFSIKKGRGMTTREAYNMLQGRAVRKNVVSSKGEEYKEWKQLDFTKKDKYGNYVENRYNDGYGYDLREAVAKFPVTELDGGKKEEDLLRSLERGNAQVATIDNNGEPMKVFLEANPKYKTINVYDEHFKMMKHEQLPMLQKPVEQSQQLGVSESTATNAKQSQSQSTDVSVKGKSVKKITGKGLNGKHSKSKNTKHNKGMEIS